MQFFSKIRPNSPHHKQSAIRNSSRILTSDAM